LRRESGWYRWVRGGLFRMDAEAVHHRVMGAMCGALAPRAVRQAVRRRLAIEDDRLRQEIWGVDFAHPVGLAAGFDKDGRYVNALGALGFGHVEVGTVTGRAQAGNPKPRLFRLPGDEALLNRMGFNNAGSAALRERLLKTKPECVLGINIGKSKVVPLEEAADDYAESLRRVHEFADYLVVNVSSPNTPGLRELQGAQHLVELLQRLTTLNEELGEESSGRRPLLLKISPDLSEEAIREVVGVAVDGGIDGIIATNTTISRQGLSTPVDELGAGGISGRPLSQRSVEVVAQVYRASRGKVPIIGVGGVFDAADAAAMIRAGASLVQIWTGFVYRGPRVVGEILGGLLELMDEAGIEHVSDWIGVDSPRVEEAAILSGE
jgi:dihydroorotate dehydrogenase